MRPGSSAIAGLCARGNGMCPQKGVSPLPASSGRKTPSMPSPAACPGPGARLWLSLRGFGAPWGLPALLAAS